MIFVLRK